MSMVCQTTPGDLMTEVKSMFVLGEPSNKSNIRLLDTRLQRNTLGDRVPPNEFWVYHHVAYDAHYIFVNRGGKSGYKVGQPLDLIPKRYQLGNRNSRLLLLWMDEVYGQLAVNHNIYGSVYDEVANYVAIPVPGEGSPTTFATRIMHNVRVENNQLTQQRRQNVPALYSDMFGVASQLDVPFRWARFLQEDGGTRLDVYWSLDPEALKPSRKFFEANEA